MVVPFMTLYLTSDKMGYSVADAGLVFGLFGAGAFCGAWLGGRLTDRIGFYYVQIMTLAGGGILFMVLGQMKSFPLICLVTFAVSFVNEAFRPANSTAIAFYSKPQNRTRSYALNRLAINLGWAAGSAIGGILAEINYELLFWVDGFTNIFAAVIMVLFIPKVDHRSQHHETPATTPLVAAYRDKTFLVFIVFTCLFAACFFQMFTNLPVYFRKHFSLSEGYIGQLMALNGIIIALVEMVLVYKLEGKRRNMIYITGGVALCGLSFLLLNTPGASSGIALVMIIGVTFGEIFSMPFMNSYWIARAQPANRGQYAALYTMAWSAAQTLGPMGGAVFADKHGFTPLWWVVGGTCVVAAYGFSKIKN